MAPRDSENSLSTVELTRMRQQMEIRGPGDDWTGTIDAATRRKLQNRRRRSAKPAKSQSQDSDRPTAVGSSPESRVLEKFKGLIVLGQKDSEFARAVAAAKTAADVRARIAELLIRFERQAHRDYILGSPRVDQLLTLIQFNVFRALLSNTVTMGWGMEWLECDEPISPWNHMPPNSELLFPLSLRPTRAQRMIVHHPWIDLWPIPKMRDNLLLAQDSYDEDELCNDLVEFCDVPQEQTGLIVWGEPWDPTAWEASEAFLRKWGWAVKGCIGLLHSTNHWRVRRGEEPLSNQYL